MGKPLPTVSFLAGKRLLESSVSQLVRGIRKRDQQGQVEFAKFLGISQASVSKLERRSTPPLTLDAWIKLCERYNITDLNARCGFLDGNISKNGKTSWDTFEKFVVPERYQLSPTMTVKSVLPLLELMERSIGEIGINNYLRDVLGFDTDYFINLDAPLNVVFLFDLMKEFNARNISVRDQNFEVLATDSFYLSDSAKIKNSSGPIDLAKRSLRHMKRYNFNHDVIVDEDSPDKFSYTLKNAAQLRHFEITTQQLSWWDDYAVSFLRSVQNYNGMQSVKIDLSRESQDICRVCVAI